MKYGGEDRGYKFWTRGRKNENKIVWRKIGA